LLSSKDVVNLGREGWHERLEDGRKESDQVSKDSQNNIRSLRGDILLLPRLFVLHVLVANSTCFHGDLKGSLNFDFFEVGIVLLELFIDFVEDSVVSLKQVFDLEFGNFLIMLEKFR